MTKRRSREEVGDRINLFRMLRDVLIQAMSKGQLLAAGVILVVIVMVLKMPAADVTQLAMRVIDLLVAGRLLGWGLAVAFVGGWLFHAKRQRREIAKEIDRLSGERDKWQRKLIDGKVISSED